MRAPEGRRRQLTDAQLRAYLKAELTPKQIAEKQGVTPDAVRKRIRQLETTTAAATVAPAESKQFVTITFNAIERLEKSLERVELLQDACDRWLRDANDPTRYDLGMRAEDIEVTWIEWGGEGGGIPLRQKERLSKLLEKVQGITGKSGAVEEYRVADPRDLILRTVAQSSAVIGQGVELLRMLRDSQAMEAFREELLRAVGEADPETRTRIEERLRSRLVLFAAASGLGVLPGGEAA